MHKNFKKILLIITAILLSSIILVIATLVTDSDAELFMDIWFFSMPTLGIIFANLALKITYNESIIKFDRNYEYFRELIKQYNPNVLAYLFSSIKYPTAMMIGLIQLERKHKIKFAEKIIINEELMPVTRSEEYLLNCIKKNNLTVEANEEYLEILKNECCYHKLGYKVPTSYIFNGTLKSAIIFAIYAIIIIAIFYEPLPTKDTTIPMFLGMEGLTVYIIYNFFFAVYNAKTSLHSFVKTNEGEEIVYKLEGLKRFLNDFSNLDEKDKKYITLWDDYILYSMMFNQNKKIYYELIKYFKNSNNQALLI